MLDTAPCLSSQIFHFGNLLPLSHNKTVKMSLSLRRYLLKDTFVTVQQITFAIFGMFSTFC